MNCSDKENLPLTKELLDADQIYRQGNITGKKIQTETESCKKEIEPIGAYSHKEKINKKKRFVSLLEIIGISIR